METQREDQIHAWLVAVAEEYKDQDYAHVLVALVERRMRELGREAAKAL